MVVVSAALDVVCSSHCHSCRCFSSCCHCHRSFWEGLEDRKARNGLWYGSKCSIFLIIIIIIIIVI